MSGGLLPPETFDENALDALADGNLRAALTNATDLFKGRRSAAIDAVEDWEPLRERARSIKEEALAHLDEYLEQFERNAIAAGAQVHWARDADEACRVVGEIARASGARRLVKSKSMTTEEVHLNDALQRDGCIPIETDLGEWIIQLAGEVPSHIIVPAIHKSCAEIADLFVEKLRIEPTDDAAVLTAAARKILRRHFAEADLGISGVNFAIAETGSFLVLENEGNARMSTTLPRVHVAMMGIEKVIPRFADLEVFLRLLPRSGTGQHLTSYQSIFTGPSPGDGPEELHIVLLDNGRSAMLRDEVLRQTLQCIRCGACLNACPVYREVGGHAYGSVYPGPIGAIVTPQLGGIERARQLPYASSLCGACRDVCPVKIDIPEVLLDLRARIASGDGAKPKRLERLGFRMWSWVCASPARYRLGARMMRLAPGLLPRAPLASKWRAARELRPLATRSFRSRWKDGGS